MTPPFDRTVLFAALLAGVAVAQAPTAPAVAAPIPSGAPEAMARIERGGLRAHAMHLASEELGGRYTSSRGQVAAARYIAEHFESLGLEPLGDLDPQGSERSLFHSWPVVRTALDEDESRVRFGERELKRGFAVLADREARGAAVDGRLVFCQYRARSDLPEAFAEDEIPVVLLRTRDRAGLRVEAQFMTGLQAFQKTSAITRNLVRRGARVAVFGMLNDDSGVGEMLNYAGLLPDKPLLQYGRDRGMAAMIESMKQSVPMVFLSRATTLSALGECGYVVTEDDGIVMPEPPDDPTGAIAIAIDVDPDARALNVCAVLRGRDEALTHEAIVYSAHMDHMGTRLDEDAFNGADDNASGSAALMAIASVYADSDTRPRRSVVFLSVSGEELGLWGSAHYATNPTWPIDDIVANVNIDMIGRSADLSDENEISVTPSYRHHKYSSIGRDAARLADRFDLGLTNGDVFYARSDHYNFARQDVPVVFFCDGEHEDYHKVTDTPDKLDYVKMERVSRLAFWTGWTVANADSRPEELGRQRGWLPQDGR